MWTIKYEIACYAVTFLLGICGFLGAQKKRHLPALFLIMLMASAGLEWYGEASCPVGYALHLATFYAAGTIIYCFRDRIPRARSLMFASIGLVLLSWHTRSLTSITFPTAGAYLLFQFIYSDKPLFPGLKDRVGDLSYGLYLYGWPIAQCTVALVGARMHRPWMLAFATVIASASLAFASWHLLEKPVLSWVVRHCGRGASVPSRMEPVIASGSM